MKPSVERLKQRFYAPERGWIDGTRRFEAMVRGRLRPEMTILDLGAGPGSATSLVFRGRCRSVLALDPDDDVKRNRGADHRLRGGAEALPFRADSVDLVFSDWVLEHLSAPEVAAREVARILKPGGVFLFRTGNLRHYAFAIAARTPQWFHRLVANWARGLPPEAADPHPTFYRMNTATALRGVLARAGFEEDELLEIEAEPSYLAFSVPSFLLGVAYERAVNRWSALSGWRAGLLGCFRKPT